MDNQTLVKNLFNDMFGYLNGRKPLDLSYLAETYQEAPLFLAFLSGLDQAVKVPFNDVMKQCYAFFKQYCGKNMSEQEWNEISEGIQVFNQKWQNPWCRGLMLALLALLEEENKENAVADQDNEQIEEDSSNPSEIEEEPRDMNTAA